MGDLTSTSAQYTREWLEESVSDSATVNEEQDSIEHPEGFASQLYNSCRTVFQGACTRMCLGAREEFAKLYLWGQSFGPTELDIALEYSDEAHSVVLDALGCIGQLLLDGELPMMQRCCIPFCLRIRSAYTLQKRFADSVWNSVLLILMHKLKS